MGIRERIDDGRLLYENERKQGAFLSVLVAVAATSRRRYPRQDWSDKESFIRFLVGEYPAFTRNCNWQPASESDYEQNIEPRNFPAGQDPIGGYWFKVPGAEDQGWHMGRMPLPAILYAYVRCSLAHEARLPSNVEFIDAAPGCLLFQVEPTKLILSYNLLDGLSKAVTFAPENFDEFPEIKELPDDIVAWMLFGHSRGAQEAYMQRRTSRIRDMSTAVN